MAVVNLSVPYEVRALQRGERIVLRDVLRVERVQDDLLAWVRQVDGTVALQRLEGFFQSALEVTLVTLPAEGQSGIEDVFTARSEVSSTVLATDQAEASQLVSIDGGFLWLQLLVNDLAQVDAAWFGLAERLQTTTPVLDAVYVKLAAMDTVTQATLSDDPTAGRASFFPQPIAMQLASGGQYINLLMQSQGVQIVGHQDSRLAVRLEIVGSQTSFILDYPAGAPVWPLALTPAQISALGDGTLSVRALYRSPTGQWLGEVTALTLTIDTQSPATPRLESIDAAADGAINLAEAQAGVAFHGTSEGGSKVQLRWSDAQQPFATVTTDASGRWSYTASLTDLGGNRNVSLNLVLRAVDRAGNPSLSDAIEAVTIQTAPPAAPTALLVDPTASRWSELATSDTTPGFNGSGPANGKVIWYLDRNGDSRPDSSEWLAEATVNSSGFYVVDLPALAAGQTHTLLAVAVDRFVNRSVNSAVVPLTVDTSAPLEPMLNAVTGNNSISYAEHQRGITVTGEGEAGSKVQLQRQQGSAVLTNDVIVDSNGTWKINLASTEWGVMTTGAVQFELRQIDPAGNTSAWTSPLNVPVRMEALQGVQNLQLLATDDTGWSPVDGITANKAPTLTGTAGANAVVRLVVDSNGDGALSADEAQNVLAEVTANASGVFSWSSWPGQLTNGSDLRILALGWDAATGSWSNASPITGLPVNVPTVASVHLRVDTVAPDAPRVDIVADNDVIDLSEMATGVRFSGQAEPGTQVTVRWLNTLSQSLGLNPEVLSVDSLTGSWSVVLDSDALMMLGSSVRLEVRVTDAAGNTNSGSVTTHDFSIDTTRPASPSVLSISSDTGGNINDGLTRISTQVLSGTAVAGATVTVFNDANNNELVDTGETLAVVTSDSSGTFQTAALTFAEGSYKLRAVAQVAGIDSVANTTRLLQVDTTAPQVTLVDVAAAVPGSGRINIATVAAGTTFGGAAENGATVTLKFQDSNQQWITAGGQVLSYTVNPTPTGGSWQVALTNAQLTELAESAQGTITAVATQTDAAGNEGTSTQNLVLDTVRPGGTRSQMTTVLDLQIQGELGAGLQWAELVDGVNVQVALPDNLGSGGQLTLKWGNQTLNHAVSADETSQGYAVVVLTADKVISAGQGTVTVLVSFMDAAGNTTIADLGVTNSDSAQSNLTVDFSARPPGLAISPDSYHRLIAGTYYSRAVQGTTLQVSGVAGDTITVKEGANELAVVTLDGFGQGSVVVVLSPSATPYTLTAQAPGTAASTLLLVMDNTRPGMPTVQPLNDTLINGTERNQGVQVSGTCDDRAEVSYWLLNTVTGVASDTVTVPTSGTAWSAYVSLEQWFQVGDGTLRLFVTQTDWAGNVSDPVETRLTLDAAVLSPVVNTLADDNRINAAEVINGVVLRGAAEPAAQMVITLHGSAGNVTQTLAADSSTGLWSWSLTSSVWQALGEGAIRLEANQTDLAGNVSASTVKSLTLDTISAGLTLSAFAGDDHLNLAEHSLSQTLAGQGEAGASVQIDLGGLTRSVMVSSNGRWSTVFSAQELQSLTNRVSLSVVQTDAAGNTASASKTLTVNDSALSGAISLNMPAEVVTWSSQASAITLSGLGPVGTQVYLQLAGAQGQVDLGPALVDTSGSWSLSLSSSQMRNSLGAGAVTVQLWAANSSGDQSTALAGSGFTLASQIPSPTLQVIADDGIVNQAEQQAGVVLTGTGVAGYTIEVSLVRGTANLMLGTQVGANGVWTLPLQASDYSLLGEGAVNVSVVQKSGGLSSVAMLASLTVDTVAPAAPSGDSLLQAQTGNAASELAGGVTAIEAVDGVVVMLPLPSNAAVGDVIELFWGTNAEAVVRHVLRTIDISTGNILSLTVPGDQIALRGSAPAGDLSITYRVTDAAGNADVSRTLVSNLTVAAPPLAPQFNAVATDGFINAQECNQAGTSPLTVNGQVSGTGAVTLQLSGALNTLTFTPTVSAGTWSQTLTQTQLDALGEGLITLSAYQVVAGVTSPTATSSFVFDKTPPTLPSAENLRAALEKNADTELAGGLLASVNNNGLTEAYDGTVLYVALSADAKAGDALQVFWNSQIGSGGSLIDVVLSATDVLRGYTSVTISEELITQAGDNPNLHVEARAVDRAGNQGPRYEVLNGPVDAVPEAPTLEPVGVDGLVNIVEMAGALVFRGKSDSGVTVHAQLAKGTQTIATTLTANNQGDWSWTLSNDEKAKLIDFGQGAFEFRARQLDVATIPGMLGNPSRWASASIVIDTVAPLLPRISDVTADNRIGSSEAQSTNGVRVWGSGEAGASLVLSFQSNGTSVLGKSGITVNSDGIWEVVLATSDFAPWPVNTGAAGVPITLAVKQTDLAGNPSGTQTKVFVYSDDVVLPPASLQVNAADAAHPNALQDGYFNAAEASGGMRVSGTGQAGRWVRVSLTVGDVVTDLPLALVDAQGQWSVLIQGAEMTALGQGAVTVLAVQRNGDTSSADESSAITFGTPFVIDTVLPALQASVLSVVSSTEQSLPHAKVGDVLLLKVRVSESASLSGGTPEIELGLGASKLAVFDPVRSAALGANWLVFAYTVQAGDNALEGTLGAGGLTIQWNGASMIDAAGNAMSGVDITPQSHGIRVDTQTPTAPTVLNGMVPIPGEAQAADAPASEGGSVINLTELTAGKAQIRVNLAAGVLPNDALKLDLQWNNGAQTSTLQKTVLQSEIDQGFALVNLPINALSGLDVNDLQGRAQVVDVAGNTSLWSGWSTAWVLDTLAPVTPVIGLVAGDNRMSANERANLGSITVGALEVGTTVQGWVEGFEAVSGLTVRRDVVVAGGLVSASELTTALAGLADGTWTINVSQTDRAGNVSTTASRIVALDTNVPGQPLLSVAGANDGWVNIAETLAGLTVTVDLRNTRAKANDELVFSWTDASNVTRTHRHLLVSGQPETLLSLVLPAAFVTQSANMTLADPFALSVQIEDTGGNTSSLSTLNNKQLDTFVAQPLINAASLLPVNALAARSNGSFSGTGAEAGASVEVLLTSTTTGQVRRMSTVADSTGLYTFTLTPSDYKDLGGANASSAINVAVTQTDRAGNMSTAASGSFQLELSLSPPTFFDLGGDNLVSATEALAGQTLSGKGSAGASLQLQFFDASAAAGATALLTLNGISVNASTGAWSVQLTSAQFNTLAGGATTSRTIRTVATQTLGGSSSDPGTLQFVVDMSTPTLVSLSQFDANGDGGNNDGLLLTLSEAVQVSGMTLLSSYSAGAGETLGTGARVEAVNTVSQNGALYAQTFRIYLGNDHTLSGSETLTLQAAKVLDMRGNAASTNLTAAVPALAAVGRPTPPLVLAQDNAVNTAEAFAGVTVPFTFAATQAANSFMRVYVNGVQVQVNVGGSLMSDVAVTSTQTSLSVTLPQASWGVDGSKTVTAQLVIAPGTINERSSMFSTSKIAVLDTSVDGAVQSMVLVQHDGDGLLETGEKIRLTFKESVKLGAGTLGSAFGAGAALAAVAPLNGYAQQWDVTLGTNPTLTPGQTYRLSSGLLTTGVRYVMVRNNPGVVDTLAFGELVILNASGENIALGKPTLASSSYSAQYDKSKIVDGDASGSETSSWSGTTSGDQWVQVDLGQTYDLNAIVLVPRNLYGESKSFSIFAGSANMSTQSYAVLAANTSLYQYNYSSSTALTGPLVLGQSVVAIDTAGNITGAVTAALPAALMTLPQVGYIDAVSSDNVLSATDLSATSIDVKVVLKSAQAGDVIKLFMDGQQVGARTLLSTDVSNGFVNVAVNRSEWGADGERMLQSCVDRGGISSELSVARAVYVQADQAHWSLVRGASAIWFDPDNLAGQGLGTAVTDWRASAGGATASNTDVTQRPTLIMVNGHYALSFDGSNDNLNYADPLSIIPKAANSTVGYDITGFAAIQSQTATGGFRTALSYWGDTPGAGVARGVKLGIQNSQLTYTTYSLLDFNGPNNSVSPNSTTVLTLRDYYDSSAMAYRMQGYNLNVQDINQTGNNSRVNMTIAPTAMRIGADTNYGVRAYWQGMIGDTIWLNYKVSDAQMYEIQTYLAAKYASVGFWVTQASSGVYRLDTSSQSAPLIDQRVDFRNTVTNETVKVAGADYVQTGRGEDTVQLKDLYFRYLDGGQGLDTLQWATDYNGPSSVILADYVSNVRGLSGNTTDDTRVNAAGFHALTGFERLDLRQIGLQSGASEVQVLTVAAADIRQLAETDQLEVLLGTNDVLKTSGFSQVSYGNFLVNNNFYGERHQGTVNGVQVDMYVRGGSLAPDPSGVSINGNALQLDFNAALTGSEPALGDFMMTSWGAARSVDLSRVSSLNNRQSLYMEFLSPLTVPVKVEYRGTSLKDEYGRSFSHTVWGVGTEGNDVLDASSWDATRGAVLLAGNGNDSVIGTAGNDAIVGGFGADTLSGGGGADRFVYKTITQGTGGTGGLGGTGGDVITDFNTSRNSTNADVLDLSDLFELPAGTRFTGDARADTQTLLSGKYLDLVRTNSGKDLQVWADRDGGGVTGLLLTLKDIGIGPNSYFSVENESSEQLMQRLLTEGRVQVTHA